MGAEAEQKVTGLLATCKQVIENGISAAENLPACDDPSRYLVEEWLPFARSVVSDLDPEEKP